MTQVQAILSNDKGLQFLRAETEPAMRTVIGAAALNDPTQIVRMRTLRLNHPLNGDCDIDTDGSNLYVFGSKVAYDYELSERVALAGDIMTGQLEFSGVDHFGIRLNSLTTTERNNLAPLTRTLHYNASSNRVEYRRTSGFAELLDSAGGQTINSTITATGLATFAGVNVGTSGSVRLTSSGYGVLTALDSDGTGNFVRFNLGGNTSGHPSIKRSGSLVAFRLADDSADAAITAGAATFSGNVSVGTGDATQLSFGTGNAQIKTRSISGSQGLVFRVGGVDHGYWNHDGELQTTKLYASDLSVGNTFTLYGSQFSIGSYSGIARLELRNGPTTTRWYMDGRHSSDNYDFWLSRGGPALFSLSTSGDVTLAGGGKFSKEVVLDAIASMTHGLTIKTTGSGKAIRVQNAGGTDLWSVGSDGQMTIPALVFIGFANGGSRIGDPNQIITGGGTGIGIKTDGSFLVATGGVSTKLSISAAGDAVLYGSLSISGDVGFNRLSAQTFQTRCFDTSLSAWQETSQHQASATGAKFSVLGATPQAKKTHAAVATDLATAITRLNQLCSDLTSFGFFN